MLCYITWNKIVLLNERRKFIIYIVVLNCSILFIISYIFTVAQIYSSAFASPSNYVYYSLIKQIDRIFEITAIIYFTV